MADTLQFDLVSPEKRLSSVKALRVQLPGAAGDFTALPKHAPFLTTLRPGVIQVQSGADTIEYVVTGGFAEVSPEAATVLAERAVERSAVMAGMLDDLQKEAEKAAAEASEDARIAANQRVNDVITLRKQLGL
jgi:F-type H+-transporting ATPase subunit epsilon